MESYPIHTVAIRDITDKYMDMKQKIQPTRRPSKGITRSRSRSRSDEGYYTNSSSSSTSEGPGSSTSGTLAYNFASIKDQLPPLWVDLVEQVETNIEKIHEKQDILSKLHDDRVKDIFGKAEEKNEKDIDTITTQITTLFREAENILVKIDKSDLDTLTSDDTATADSDIKLRKNIQRALATKLHEESNIFRKNQRSYLCKLKAQKNGTTEEQEWAYLNENEQQQNNKEVGTGQDLTLEQVEFIDVTSNLVEERDQEITAIAQSIEELATIMKELAALVIDQGTILDRIDYNMDVTVERIKEGMSELEKAEKYQKSATPVKCIIVLLVIIFFLAMVLLFKHVKPGNNS